MSHIERVAIVGATGRVGGAFAEALVASGKHTVTALTRAGSKGKLPSGVKAAVVDYSDEGTLVSALQGQQFLVITLSVTAPADTHDKLVAAAAAAGVPYVMPNAYGSDIFNAGLCAENPWHDKAFRLCEGIEASSAAAGRGGTGPAFVALCCGFWYEWSLALGEPWYGFDIAARTVTFFDDGRTLIASSTWEQCGRALAGFLALPESEVATRANKPLYVASFRVSQRDMLDSLNRVLGTTDADWTITYEPSDKRRDRGNELFAQGQLTGMATAMYARVFYPNGGGDFEGTRGLDNEWLGLQKEDLDVSTKKAVQWVESGWNPFHGSANDVQYSNMELKTPAESSA